MFHGFLLLHVAAENVMVPHPEDAVGLGEAPRPSWFIWHQALGVGFWIREEIMVRAN